jgi:hypothetical protein
MAVKDTNTGESESSFAIPSANVVRAFYRKY